MKGQLKQDKTRLHSDRWHANS